MLTHPVLTDAAQKQGLKPALALFGMMTALGDEFERVVCGQGQTFLDMAEKERESVLSEARTQTQFLDSPALKRTLPKSDFRLKELKDRITDELLPEGKETVMTLEKDRAAWTVTINVNGDFIDKPDLGQLFEPAAQHLRAFAFPDDGLKLELVLANGLRKKLCELDDADHLACR